MDFLTFFFLFHSCSSRNVCVRAFYNWNEKKNNRKATQNIKKREIIINYVFCCFVCRRPTHPFDGAVLIHCICFSFVFVVFFFFQIERFCFLQTALVFFSFLLSFSTRSNYSLSFFFVSPHLRLLSNLFQSSSGSFYVLLNTLFLRFRPIYFNFFHSPKAIIWQSERYLACFSWWYYENKSACARLKWDFWKKKLHKKGNELLNN